MPLFKSILTDRFYFASRVKRVNDVTMQVVGKKVDVTDDVKRIVWDVVSPVWDAAVPVITGKMSQERLGDARLDAMDRLKAALIEFQKTFAPVEFQKEVAARQKWEKQ